MRTNRITAADGAVALEYEAHGRTAKGAVYENYYVTVLTVSGGKISEVRPHNDTAHMLSLIGD